MSKPGKLANAMIAIVSLTVASRILGYARDAFVAANLGVSGTGDAYYLASSIPGFFEAGFICLTSSFIPLFIDARMNRGDKKAFSFVNNILNLYMLAGIILVLFGMLFTPGIVKLFAPGMEPAYRSISSALTRIAFPVVFFRGIMFVMTGVLQAERRFSSSCLEGILLSVTTIFVCLFAYRRFGTYSLIAAFVLAYVIYDILLVILTKKRFKYHFIIDFKDEYLRKLFVISLPILLETAVREVNMIIYRSMASGLGKGIISALYYTDRINGIIIGIFVYAVCLVMYPEFSESSARNDMCEIGRKLKSAVTAILMFCIPVTLYVVFMGRDIVRVLFERGDFDSQATHITAYALGLFVLVIVPQGVRDILNRIYFSLKDTRTPMISSIIGIVVNIVLNLALVRHIGLAGLSLSAIASYYISAVLQLLWIIPRVGSEVVKGILSDGLKVCVVSLPAGLSVFWAGRAFVESSSIVRLSVTFFPAAVVYLAGICFLNMLGSRTILSGMLKSVTDRIVTK